ncbi:MAG: 2,4-dihydroxyhept-2-ene-1,7-dioic acid aldolase [Mesorhizobium sp.]|nr:2,4-dihydroxyhept-2-ene-1,7-dioic acid aldolase [Mesorhizobium sp.]
MFENKIKSMWSEGRPILNGWLSIGSPFTAEIMSIQGYDSLTVDLQHGALDYGAMLNMLLALTNSGVTPMVRVPSLEPGIVMKAIDAGAQGIICPLVNTAEQASEFVSYLRYPPVGQRSYGPTRAAFAYGGYDFKANDQLLALAMIETQQGVDNLEEIAATPGLDGLYIGPSDLTIATQSARLPPGFDRREPEMLTLIHRIMEVGKRHGLMTCLHCGEAEYAAEAIRWGFDFTTVSGDSRLLSAAAAQSVRAWKDGVGSAEKSLANSGY